MKMRGKPAFRTLTKEKRELNWSKLFTARQISEPRFKALTTKRAQSQSTNTLSSPFATYSPPPTSQAPSLPHHQQHNNLTPPSTLSENKGLAHLRHPSTKPQISLAIDGTERYSSLLDTRSPSPTDSPRQSSVQNPYT